MTLKESRRKWRLANRPWDLEYQRKRYKLHPRGTPKNNLTKSNLLLEDIRKAKGTTIQSILSRRLLGHSIRKIGRELGIPKTTVAELEKRGIIFICQKNCIKVKKPASELLLRKVLMKEEI